MGSKPVGGYVAGSSGVGVKGAVTLGVGTGTGKGGPGRYTESELLLDKGLEQELKITGYCSQGYQETERASDRPGCVLH